MRPACSPSGCGSALKKRWPPAVFKALLDHEVKAKSGDGRRRVPAPARPFADPRRERRGAVAQDLGRSRRASATSRRACATSPAPTPCPRPRCASCCSGWPRLGRVVEVAPDQYLPAARGGRDDRHRPRLRATTSPPREFRDKLDNGRKVAILILEFFDRHGITDPPRRPAPHGAAEAGAVRPGALYGWIIYCCDWRLISRFSVFCC